MELIQAFLATNQTLFAFVHGLLFFLVGFAVLLQERTRSEVTLARSLLWFGWFGIVHAFANWGEAFIPIQAAYLAPEWVSVLRLGALGFETASVLLLFAFALHLWSDTWGWSLRLPWLLSGLGLTWVFALLGEPVRLPLTWAAAAFAVMALYNQRGEFRRLGLERLIADLDWLSLALVLFGLSSMLHGVAGLLMLVLTIRLVRVFEDEKARLLEEGERWRGALEARDRIARDLHDGIIQSMYGLGLQFEAYRSLLRSDPQAADQCLQSILAGFDQTIQGARHYVTDLRAPLSIPTLRDALHEVVQQVQSDFAGSILELVRFSPRLEPQTQTHVVQIVREALVNAVRHGNASAIVLRSVRRGDALVISVEDNGCGLDDRGLGGPNRNGPEAPGRGFDYVRERTRLIGGSVRWKNRPDKGTTVSLTVPLHPLTRRFTSDPGQVRAVSAFDGNGTHSR